MTVLF